MAKAVFRPGEAKTIEEKVMLPLYKDYSPIEEAIVEEEEEYTGPTADDLRREAEEYKAQFEQEKQQLQADAQKEAERIIKAAEDTAFQAFRSFEHREEKCISLSETFSGLA